ncbi:MAG: hypothetical protein JRG92_09735 [Deltaproteobacteria bacterium]|jgi:hypothetical protein|nr:hypothetical protein [Deltaproteobacteria bacterium]MBW2696961.1 hypothetical protein [Deltaproteobacteria bacterium]
MSTTIYRTLCGALGLGLLGLGLGLFAMFFQYHTPGSPPAEPIPVGPGGAYYQALAGCALVAWGGVLLGAARKPQAAPWIASVTACALVLNAFYRILAWLIGDYAFLGNLLRVEAAIMLLLALAFVWLKPRPLVGQPL